MFEKKIIDDKKNQRHKKFYLAIYFAFALSSLRTFADKLSKVEDMERVQTS